MSLFGILCVLSSASATYITADDVEEIFKRALNASCTDTTTNDPMKDVIEILRRSDNDDPQYLSLGSQGLRMTLDCIMCRGLFAAIFAGVKIGFSDSFLVSFLSHFCTVLKIATTAVCEGFISMHLPIITYIIRTTPDASPKTFCGLLFQTEFSPNDCFYSDPRFEWKINLPEKTYRKTTVDMLKPKLHCKKLIKIAILTDAHIDPKYEPNGTANCGEPTCCRKGQKPAFRIKEGQFRRSNLLEKAVFSSSGKTYMNLGIAKDMRQMKMAALAQNKYFAVPSDSAGYWGDYRSCDTPLWAFDNVLQTIRNTNKHLDLIYYIGDTVDHGVWETTFESVKFAHKYVIDKFKRIFGRSVIVLPAIGNHDTQPMNTFTPSYFKGKFNSTWLYEYLSDIWDYYLPKPALKQFQKHGDYSMLIRPGFRVISMNNNFAYRLNWWLIFDPLEPKRRLDWLVQELYVAEMKGEKVHIIAHIPPGTEDLTFTWTREYDRIYKRFSDTIVTEFNGHMHSDEFKIFFDNLGRPSNVAWTAGGATTYSFFNYNYKIVYIHPQTYKPVNILTYIYNITEANLSSNKNPKWFLLYDLKKSFHISNLSPISLYNVVKKMASEEKWLALYLEYYWKNSDVHPDCDDMCKLGLLCNTVITVLWKRDKCEQLKDMYFIKHDSL